MIGRKTSLAATSSRRLHLMANKRQRFARTRFRECSGASVDHSQPPQRTPSLKPHKKEKKVIGKKRKQEDSKDISYHREEARDGDSVEMGGIARKKMRTSNEGNVGTNRSRVKRLAKPNKHPLRIEGRRPGEGCFICKATDHVVKTCPQVAEKDRKKICLFCRQVGHTLKRCPNKEAGEESKFCYNCGEIGHRLSECSQPIKNGGTTFAKCFLCKQEGHLSKNCPSNAHGIYPKGGSCKICGAVTHLAKDCSEKNTKSTKDGIGRIKLEISKEATPASRPGENGKRIVFRSGDDIEDDFVQDDQIDQITETYIKAGALDKNSKTMGQKKPKHKGDKMKESRNVLRTDLKAIAKNQQKLTTKVVNFFQ